MPYRPTQSKKRQNRLAEDMATDFDAVPLHNTVYENIGEDDQLAQLCDATAMVDTASDRRETENGTDAVYVEDIEEAWGRLSYIARHRAREVVAESCAEVIEEDDQWVAEGHWERETIETAKQEAREWLRSNTDVSSRLDGIPLA